MADNPTNPKKAKAKNTYIDWRNRPYAGPSAASEESKKRSDLWDALNVFIQTSGAWLTSLPGVSVLRVEVPQGSLLPAKLIELGYNPRHCGTGTRLTPGGTVETVSEHCHGKPITRQHHGFVPIDIIEIKLPGK